MACLLLLVVLLALIMLTGLTGCACLAIVALWGMRGIWSPECAALASMQSKYADLSTDSSGTMRSFFAQRDHIMAWGFSTK